MLGKLLGQDPGKRLPFCPMGLAFEGIDLQYIQQYLLVGIIVTDLDQRPRPGNLDAQFLTQFTPERARHGFARFHLATGKLPEPTLMLGFGASRNQDPPIAPADDGCCHMDPLHPARSARPAWRHAWKAGH